MRLLRGTFLGMLLVPWFYPVSAQAVCDKPVWPREALRYELQGVSQLSFRIAADDQVVQVQVDKSSGWPMLDEAAVRSLSACRMKLENPDPSREYKLQYVWKLPEAVHPQLVQGSCVSSEQFAGFDPKGKAPTNGDGMLVRLLVKSNGEPFGIKLALPGVDPATTESALAFLQTCRFTYAPGSQGNRSDTVTGRLLYK